MTTVGQPTTIWSPLAVASPLRAAGLPPISTVGEPTTMGTLLGRWPVRICVHELAISPARAAGCPQIKTVEAPGPRIVPLLVASPTRAAGAASAGA